MENFLTSLISGGIAGLTADVCLYPLDTIKTRMQAKEGFLSSGGFKGIYRGLSAVSIGSIPGGALFFATYDTSKSFLTSLEVINLPPAVIHMISASFGELIGCLIRVPTEVIKQRMQAGLHKTLPEAVSKAYELNGIRGFYVGYGATILREIPFSFIQFPIYERMKTEISKSRNGEAPKSYESALCGAISGSFSAAITTPLDVLKTRKMLTLQSSDNNQKSFNVYRELKLLYKEGGMRTLFAGVEPRVVWIGLGGFCFFGGYEQTKKILNSYST